MWAELNGVKRDDAVQNTELEKFFRVGEQLRRKIVNVSQDQSVRVYPHRKSMVMVENCPRPIPKHHHWLALDAAVATD